MSRSEKKISLAPLCCKNELFSKKHLLLAASFFIPAILLAVLRMRCVSLHGGEAGSDGFYHAAMALQGSSLYTAKKFPFLALSIWNETFADKELLYHILLGIPFYLQKTLTGKTFPFTFPVLCFAWLALLSFIILLKTLKIPEKIIFLSSLLFSFCSFVFLYRFLVLRPHVFSIALITGACALFAIRNLKRKCAAYFLLAVIYAWSYSNPHFLLLPILFYSFFARKEYAAKILFLPVLSGLGLAAGYLIHPQFPNTFAIWKVQSLDALLNPLFHTNSLAPKLTPMEMLPGNFAWYRNALPLYMLCYISLYLFIRLKEKVRPLKIQLFTPAEKTVFLLAVFFICATFAVLRAVEYAQLFAVTAFAILLAKAQKYKCGFFAWKIPSLRVYSLLFLLTALFFTITSFLFLKSDYRHTPPYSIAKYLKENTPEGSLILNLNWGDFPAMFYTNTHNTLLWGMDPAFSYAAAPGKARDLENCVLNATRKPGFDATFHALTGADHAFILSRGKKYIHYLKRQGWKVLYESDDGCVFSLKNRH